MVVRDQILGRRAGEAIMVERSSWRVGGGAVGNLPVRQVSDHTPLAVR
jgi:hypothetical protein